MVVVVPVFPDVCPETPPETGPQAPLIPPLTEDEFPVVVVIVFVQLT